MTKNKKQKQKKGAERHHPAGDDRGRQTGKKMSNLPVLKRIFNLQGLIFEGGTVLSTPQLDTKFRNALCHRLTKFNAATITRRMNELFHKLYIHRESLREETGLSWLKQQKFVTPEDLASFVYTITDARARASNNALQDMNFNRQKRPADFVENIDNFIEFLESKHSLYIPSGQALEMGEYRDLEEEYELDAPEGDEAPQYEKPSGLEGGFLLEAMDALEQDTIAKEAEDSFESARVQVAEKSMETLTIEDEYQEEYEYQRESRGEYQRDYQREEYEEEYEYKYQDEEEYEDEVE
ncbi:hypothetical protein KJ359_005869 [Pestalotiopsis sp. 9143b]|nr:hypothetical protein KJ359_005869 [Pestalotiopsis sp. 9143b]